MQKVFCFKVARSYTQSPFVRCRRPHEWFQKSHKFSPYSFLVLPNGSADKNGVDQVQAGSSGTPRGPEKYSYMRSLAVTEPKNDFDCIRKKRLKNTFVLDV